MNPRTGYLSIIMLIVIALCLGFGVGCSKGGDSKRPQVKVDGNQNNRDDDDNGKDRPSRDDRIGDVVRPQSNPTGIDEDGSDEVVDETGEFTGKFTARDIDPSEIKKLTPPTSDYRTQVVGRDRTAIIDQSVFPSYHASGDTGYWGTIEGEDTFYVDLFADGIMTGLRRQMTAIEDPTIKTASIALARSVYDIRLLINNFNINVEIDFLMPGENAGPGPNLSTIRLAGNVDPVTRTGEIYGYSNGRYVFTGRVECMDTDINHCQTVRVGIFQFQDQDRDGKVDELCKKFFFVHRHGNAAVELPESTRLTYKRSPNTEFARFIEFIDNTIVYDETNGAVDLATDYVSRAQTIGLRTWAVAEGPSEFVVTIGARAMADNRTHFNGQETSFRGPLLAGITGNKRNLELSFGNKNTFWQNITGDLSGSFAHAFRDVRLNDNGTNGVISVGIVFDAPIDKVDLVFFSTIGQVGGFATTQRTCPRRVHVTCRHGVVGATGLHTTFEASRVETTSRQPEVATTIVNGTVTHHHRNGAQHVDTTQNASDLDQDVLVETQGAATQVVASNEINRSNDLTGFRHSERQLHTRVESETGSIEVDAMVSQRTHSWKRWLLGVEETHKTDVEVVTTDEETGEKVITNVETQEEWIVRDGKRIKRVETVEETVVGPAEDSSIDLRYNPSSDDIFRNR